MKSLRYLNKYFLKYKWRLLLGILFIIATNILKVFNTQFFGENIDTLKNWGDNGTDGDIMLQTIKVGAIYMGVALFSGVFLFFTRQMIIIVSRLIEYDLKNEIYEHYQKLDYTFYKKNSTGDLMNRISEDVTKVRMYLGPGIMYTINLAILSILTISYMVSISPMLTVFVLLPLPIMSFLIYKVSSRINALSADVQKEQSDMSTLVQESFSGIRVIKAYSRSGAVNENFSKSSESYKDKNMRLVLINALFMPTVYVLIGVSTLLCIYIGGLFSFSKAISVGEILQFIIFVNMLTWPFASVGWVISINQRAAASQTRINEFLQTKPEIVNTNHGNFNFEGNIEFRNVSYTYPNSGIEAISNLSFTVAKGESLGIIGRTGSGKSTILKLLARQIEPTEGEIFIDGQPLNTINVDAFKDQIGVVPQDVFLFSDSIRNNLLFGTKNGKATDEELIEVCKKAHVWHNISSFPDGLDTLLGERGVNLSGGQKQRLSIARALIRKPKLLVLDDCLSAVDTETEEIILRNIKQEKFDSSIVVSHRVSSIRNTNFIITLEDGKLVESGDHESLLQKDGVYAHLYRKQLTEENEASEFED